MLTKNYAIEICNFLNEEENEGIDFNIQFRRKGDHKGLAINLFIAKRQFEFNIYNVHHEKHCFGCGVELTEDNFLEEIYLLTGLEVCRICDHNGYNIDAVHPIFRRIVKINWSHAEILKLYNELQHAGYEDIIITKEKEKK
jgi:hypothetical protein